MTTFTTAAAVARYALAGKAVISLRSKKTGNHLTFLIERNRQNALRWWVSVKGVDTRYRYLGMLEDQLELMHSRTGIATRYALLLTGKSAAYRPSLTVNAFDYFIKHVLGDDVIPADLEVRHEGHCGRCGRGLTDPASIDIGIGPECQRKMGIS
jgi:hypothetical protein